MKSIHYWYRQAWHALGGFLFYFALTFFVPGWMAATSVMAIIGIVEYNHHKNGQPLDKTILDPIFWLLGILIGVWRLGA